MKFEFSARSKDASSRISLEWPQYVFRLTVLIVLGAFLTYYLVDLRNFLGLRDFLFQVDPRPFYFTYRPFFFIHWGRNSGLAEILQFFLLGGATLIAAFLAGRLYTKHKELFVFWGLMALALVLMLIQDAGDTRHVLMGYMQTIFNEPDQGVAGTLTEFIYFAILGGIPLYALIRYWRNLQQFAKTKFYLLVGFLAYALAGSLSFIGTAFDYLVDRNLYTIMGEQFYRFSLWLGDSDLELLWQSYEASHSHFSIGFNLMDGLLEESIELIGAGAFLAAAGSFLILYFTERKNEQTEN